MSRPKGTIWTPPEGLRNQPPGAVAVITHLRYRRVAFGITQADLDDLAGCANGYIGKLECGDRRASLAMLVEWADALGCDVVIRPRKGEAAMPRLTRTYLAAERSSAAPYVDNARGSHLPKAAA